MSRKHRRLDLAGSPRPGYRADRAADRVTWTDRCEDIFQQLPGTAGRCADIVQALRSVAAGLSVIDPAARAALLAVTAPRPENPPGRKLPRELPDGLTLREAEILSMIANRAAAIRCARDRHLA